jgi:hypothetical protein
VIGLHTAEAAKVAKPVFRQIDQFGALRQLIAHERLGGSGNHDLSAVGGRHQPGAAIDRQAGVSGVVDNDSLGGVKPDTGLERCRGSPVLVVADHGGLHRVGILLPHPGRPLEIGEQEGHCARGRPRGHALVLCHLDWTGEKLGVDVVQRI